jgi:hypothetical protein
MAGMATDATVVAEPTAVRQGIWLVCPAAGAGLGWLLHAATSWLLSLPWMPFRGPLRLVESIPEPAGTLGALALGLAAGLALAALITVDQLTVTVAADRVEFSRGNQSSTVDGATITTVFPDGKTLVLLGADGTELAREKSDLSRESLAQAFRDHGYRWVDADPYAPHYRRWVADLPGLPPGANELLKARDKALHKGADKEVRELRAELVKLGVMVREEKKRQYFRVTADGVSTSDSPT